MKQAEILQNQDFTGHEIVDNHALIQTSFRDTYSKSYIAILPVATHLVHIFWNIDRFDLINNQNSQKGNSEQPGLFLKLYNTEDKKNDLNQDSLFFKDMNPETRCKYVNIPNPGKSYMAELGLMTQFGQVLFSIHSNIVQLPHAAPSVINTKKQMHVEKNKTDNTIKKTVLHRDLKAPEAGSQDLTESNEKEYIAGLSSSDQ